MDFLHLSDLHLRPGDEYQQKLISALLVDLEKITNEGISPQFVVFSGDLVERPNIKDVYSIFGDKVLSPILEVLGLDEAAAIFCPGNHDVNFDVMEKRGFLYDAAQSSRTELPALERYALQSDFAEYCHELSSDFFSMCQKFGHPWENPFYCVYEITGARCSFIALNGAIGCSRDGSKADRGKLGFPVEQALKAIRETGEKGLPLLGTCIHHPLGDFAEDTTRGLEPLISTHSKSHHFGHVHQSRPQQTVSSSGNTLFLQSGALYERKNAFNGYCLIRISEDRTLKEVICRTYWKDRFQFDDATDVASDGRFYTSPDAEKYWRSARPPLTDQQIVTWLKGSYLQFINDHNDTITDKSLSDTFVEPSLIKPAQGGETVEAGRNLTVKQMLHLNSHTVIAAGNEYGATSLLTHIASIHYQDGGKGVPLRVPAILDVRKLKAYPAAVKSALRAALPEATDPRYRFDALDATEKLIVLLDDFNPAEPTHGQVLATILNVVPKARVVMIAKLPLLYADHVLPAIDLPSFVFLQLRPFDRGRVRQVVQKWKLPSLYVADNVVEQIVIRFRGLGIPLTGPYLAIYLSVLEQIKGFAPINSSTIIEQFVEGVLEKYNPQYAFRSEFDYRNQIDFLAAMAENMCRANQFSVDFHLLYEWTKSYFEHIQIDQDYKKVIEYFVEDKILEVSGNRISFKYNIFLSFFIAHRMQKEPKFKEWVLEAPRYLSYVNEIDLYCGLVRNDVAIIDYFASEFEKCDKELDAEVAPLSWNEPLEKLSIPKVQDKGEFAAKIAEQLTQGQMTEAERDHALDDGGDNKVRPDLHRPNVQGIVASWILALRAYSVALKNLENIPGADKQKHLQAILDGWGKAMRYACLLFKNSLETNELAVGQLKFRLSLPDEVTTKVLRLIFMGIPTLVTQWLRSDLGTQKLEVQLKNDALAPSLTSYFLQKCLYADLRLREYLGEVQKLHNKAKGSEFFLEALMMKLRDVYVRYGLSREEEPGFLRLVAELDADVQGLTGEERKKRIDYLLHDLKQRKIVAHLSGS